MAEEAKKYGALFEPIKTGKVKIKNRLRRTGSSIRGTLRMTVSHEDDTKYMHMMYK